MRLFAALDVPDQIAHPLQSWRARFAPAMARQGWRMLEPHAWHLTLAFYGEVNGRECAALVERLAEDIEEYAAPRLRLEACGVFPSAARPRSFWVGVGDVSHRLEKLARCCRRAGHATLRKRGRREEPFRGHITLARARGKVPCFTPEHYRLPQVPALDWTPERLCLFRSWLRPEGAHYACVEAFALKGEMDV
ncbi:MAG: RNA 2',3'-cyclic phosphodiesterase [Zetaproteobacteria bacterium]|nr:MAG: RNA 2',3'-cyclic phosphodiesterase [Zetaproteobacteria bacterium]